MATQVGIQARSSYRKIAEIERQRNVQFALLPIVGLLNRPMEIDGWRVIPREMDTSPIPPEADMRLGWLQEGGVRFLQQIVIHEPNRERLALPNPFPLALPPPEPEHVPVIPLAYPVAAPRDYTREKEAAKEVLKIAGKALAITAIGVGVIAAAPIIAATAGAVVVLGGVVLALGAGVDPALVVILEDGRWMVVARWFE
jgi:hypothetical protein